MSEAPERIYLDGDVEAGDGMFPRCFEHPKYASEPQVEYIRADLVQAAVAAKLIEVHDAIADYPLVAPDEMEAQHYDEQIGHSQSIILNLITEDAYAALDRALAAERERCAKVAQQQAQAAQKEVTRLMKEHGSKTAEDIWTGRLIAAQEINAAIRKGGE